MHIPSSSNGEIGNLVNCTKTVYLFDACGYVT